MIGKCCKKKSGACTASARVVDGKLILSLPSAVSPVVWQMDLGQAKASALEVRHDAEGNVHTLTLKTPKGETVEIATFSTRELSVEGLMAASQALENAHGQIRPGAANDAAAGAYIPAAAVGKDKRGKLSTVLIALAALFILYVVWSMLMPLPVDTGSPVDAVATQAGAPDSGVPMSAEDYLSKK